MGEFECSAYLAVPPRSLEAYLGDLYAEQSGLVEWVCDGESGAGIARRLGELRRRIERIENEIIARERI